MAALAGADAGVLHRQQRWLLSASRTKSRLQTQLASTCAQLLADLADFHAAQHHTAATTLALLGTSIRAELAAEHCACLPAYAAG